MQRRNEDFPSLYLIAALLQHLHRRDVARHLGTIPGESGIITADFLV